MKKIFLNMLIIPLFLTGKVFANFDNNPPPPLTVSQIREIDAMLEKRLNLTEEQKKYIEVNRSQNKKEMEKTLKRMQVLHDDIRNTYLLGLPKFQSDIRVAPQKAELAILKQNADRMRIQNRKNFENILDNNQKNEFEKIKKEYALKNRPPYQEKY